jgi:outer membrane protein assembly factor BamB
MMALPPDAQRYLVRMRSLGSPVELVDSIMAEVEATPQVRPGPDLRAISGFALAAAAALLAFAVLLRLGAPDIGPAPTPVPLDQLPSAGRVQARIPVDASDTPVAFGHGFLWLTNAATGELVRMDPANGSIASPLAVTEAGMAIPIALTSSAVWVVDGRDGTLVELDPATLEERRRFPVGGNVSAIAADGSALWLLDHEAGELIRFDLAARGVGLTLPIAGSALLVHGGSVWVGDDAGALVGIDPTSGVEKARVDLGMAITRLVADGDSILVAGNVGDPVIRVDIGSERVLARGVSATAVAAQDGRVWAVLDSGHLVRVDPATLQPVAASDIALDPAGTLAIGGGSLWTTGVDTAGDVYLVQVVPEP